MSYFSNIVVAARTVFEGFTITFSHLLREPSTVQYPDRTLKPVKDMLPERYRGFLKVDTTSCTCCTVCASTCPIDCIHIEHGKDAETKQRVMTAFDIDLGKCMYCGLCVEQCPTGAIVFTREFEAATPNLADLVFRFVPAGTKVVPYKARKNEVTSA